MLTIREYIKMKIIFRRFVKDESGATAIEYGLIASLIGVAIIAGVTALGTSLNSTFQGVSSMVNGPSA
jgi:pilus assembly protein Flp/PilA